MKELTEADIIRIMREEWNNKLQSLIETVSLTMSKDGNEMISAGLKIVHKKSNIMYTVDSVGRDDVILKTPEGDDFLVDAQTLESDYRLA